MRFEAFECGWLHTQRHLVELHQGVGEPMSLPVPFFLLTHPDGAMLFDGGNAPAVAVDPGGHWGSLATAARPSMRTEQAALPQLARVGIRPVEIRYLVQSHLHADHTGALGRLPDAEVLVDKEELRYAQEPEWFDRPAYIAADIQAQDGRWRPLDLNGSGFDLYGDGVVTLLPTPGHSPGHLSALIRLPRSGPVLLCGDACATQAHWEERAQLGTAWCASEAAASIRRLQDVAADERALVVLGHDAASWRLLRRSPASYW